MLKVRIMLALLIISLSCESCRKEIDKTKTPTSYTDSTTSRNPTDTTKLSFNSENEFLGLGKPEFGDLDSMIARRRIRALVPYTYLYYTIDLKKRSGVAFEALNLFETSLNKQMNLKPQQDTRES